MGGQGVAGKDRSDDVAMFLLRASLSYQMKPSPPVSLPPDPHFHNLSASEIAQAVAGGEISALSMIEAALARIAKRDPVLNPSRSGVRCRRGYDFPTAGKSWLPMSASSTNRRGNQREPR
jgi:hypothetical protein